ncbi:ferritin-like domain-containing protein [Halococcus salsus]|uniref:ferritin-like domain-containing protein n=1 Tax=Halococcus salsus TaxID=2162894 RepID=UPI0013593BCB|nr:ferritin-like domain-containing protein [Halococcus salsus]
MKKTNLTKSPYNRRFEEIRDHEKAHVEALTTTITDPGGTPVQEAEYKVGYETVSEFVATAAHFKDIGMSAYAGAASFISSSEVLTSAPNIHSVEARHASYFGTLSLRQAAPDAFDTARSMNQVLP